ncbi:Lrp/AsnC family transcriptional regulator [Shimia biformata]|uniref:Lrp/AsnC family transcriptional regulator n=1 Tax=Shimia biformata TaxID=1294299 RepID=UPI0019516A87|nr:Lrp/AsnC family transcriptional regulator [Shimia biformata]
MTTPTLDPTDRRILDVLQSDGRISNLDLAAKVGLSPTPCARRVRRLEETGVIRGYGARINPAALGHGVNVIVSVRLVRQNPRDIDEFLRAVKAMPEVTECLLVTGDLDYILRVAAPDVDSLKGFFLDRLKKLPGVSNTTTNLILETVKTTR